MKKNYFALLLLATLSLGATAQITQVTDINKTGDSGIGEPYLFNGEIYFEADAGDAAADELYKYTGTETVLVKDINQDPDDSSPNSDPKYFIEYAGKLYMSANGGDYTGSDIELYSTNGTEEGTVLVHDFNTTLTKGGSPQHMFTFNNKLYMQANDGTTQIWAFDGDTIVKITNINSGGYSTPVYPKVDETNGKAWFQANETKAKLFYLDTNENSIMLTISNIASNSDCNLKSAIVYNNGLLFEGDDAVNGDELWFSNGTQEGTVMVKDINADGNSDPENFTEYNGTLYFTATVDGITQLWKTDATNAGTEAVIIPTDTVDTEIDNIVIYDNRLFYTQTSQAGDDELWAYDGTSAEKVADIDTPKGFIVVEGVLFFINNGDLWCYEATADKAIAVAALYSNGENPTDVTNEYAVIGSKLYFTGDDENGDDLFMIDASTINIEEPTLIDFKSLYAFNKEVYFEADAQAGLDDELYKLTSNNDIVLVSDINQDTAASSTNSDPSNFIEYNGELFFNANEGKGTNAAPLAYKELHSTDGTTAGTELVFDVNPDYNKQGNPQEMFVSNNKLYMQLNDGNSTQIWAHDGSSTVKIENPDNAGYSSPGKAIVDTDKVWLKASDANNKAQLYILTDTLEKLSHNETQAHYSGVGAMLNNGFIYQGKSDDKVYGVWYSDGTPDGTQLVVNLDTAGTTKPTQFVTIADKAYFLASTSDSTSFVFMTDGTTEGTVVASSPEDSLEASADNLIAFEDKLYFTTTVDDINSLWMYDDSVSVLISELENTAEDFTIIDGLMVFVSNDNLWYSEGIDGETAEVPAGLFADNRIAIEVDGSKMTSIGRKVYFVGQSVGYYVEILSVDLSTLGKTPTSIGEQKRDNSVDVTLFPMPTSGLITIESAETFSSYKVYDLSMKEVASSIIEDKQINVTLTQGMYILQLQGNDTTIAKKIMIK